MVETSTDTQIASLLLDLIGSGRDLWPEGADTYVENLRDEDGSHRSTAEAQDTATAAAELPQTGPERRVAMDDQEFQRVWDRVVACTGEVFYTKTRKAITYELQGNGMYFFHGDGRRINILTARGQLRRALEIPNVNGPYDLRRLYNPSYLYALVRDERIVGSRQAA